MSSLATNHDDTKTNNHVVQNTNGNVAITTGNKFVRVIDRKARSYLKTLERSFSSSSLERCEDPSFMTIEFLQTRLQAQRTEYQLEKQRSQQLAKKVLELQERLNWEVQLRKKIDISGNDNDNENIVSNWESQDLQYLNETLDMNDSEESSQEGGSCISSQPIVQVSKEKDHYCDVYSTISCSCIPTEIVNGSHTISPYCHCDNQNLSHSNFHLTREQPYGDCERDGNCVDMRKNTSMEYMEHTNKVHNMKSQIQYYPLQQSTIIPRIVDVNKNCLVHNKEFHSTHNSLLAMTKSNKAQYHLELRSFSERDLNRSNGNKLNGMQNPLRKTFSNSYADMISHSFVSTTHPNTNLSVENDAQSKMVGTKMMAPELNKHLLNLSYIDNKCHPLNFEEIKKLDKLNNQTNIQQPKDTEKSHHILLPLFEKFIPKQHNSNSSKMQLKHHMDQLDHHKMSLDSGLDRLQNALE